MRLAHHALLATLCATCAFGATPQKPVVVSYPKGTPDSVLDAAKKAIEKAGGVITHEYQLIRGFAANAPGAALDTVRALGVQNDVVIEEDQVVQTQGSREEGMSR